MRSIHTIFESFQSSQLHAAPSFGPLRLQERLLYFQRRGLRWPFRRPGIPRAIVSECARWQTGRALTFETPSPVPYGEEIVHSKRGESLMRAANAVGTEHDPSAPAEVRTIRLACAKLTSSSLNGYTLLHDVRALPDVHGMCTVGWHGRMVYGATIADAARFGRQIEIPATEVAKRGDMTCVVDGPVERDVCVALFKDPRMKKTFEMWNSKRW